MVSRGKFLNDAVGYAPLAAAWAYIGFTYLVYLFGPISWPHANIGTETALMAAIVGGLGVGYVFGMRRPVAAVPFASWRRFFWVGALAGIVLLFPASFIYTGKWPWDAYDAFVCPGKAYAEMLHVAQT
ncbi:MAG: hypothetical protein PHS57_10420, partial [Alphaproteobacteria bacterium]|nr:hypothetical protein [Alphaproteobacteria bacterium]